MYLSTFLPRMKIIHKSKTTHQNADGLFRLTTESCLSIIVIADEKNLLFQITLKFSENRAFAKIITKLKKQIEKTQKLNDESKIEYQIIE